MKLSYFVNNNQYETVKQVLKQEFEISDRLLLRLKNQKKIFLNNILVSVYSFINLGDKIDVLIDFEENNSNVIPFKMDLSIIYEDESLFILNKPAGIAIHPSHQHYSTSLSNGVKYYFDKIGLKKKIRPVNRLDKDTSGLVIFAKNEYIQECLTQQMKNGIFQKEYIAVVNGKLEKKNGSIIAPIARKENSIIERCVSDKGQIAVTYYDVLEEFNTCSFVHFILKTGRTHQIRVHCSYLNHSIVGDTLYGNKSEDITRQALHAHKIQFIHPITKQNLCFTAPIPNDIVNLLQKLKNN